MRAVNLERFFPVCWAFVIGWGLCTFFCVYEFLALPFCCSGFEQAVGTEYILQDVPWVTPVPSSALSLRDLPSMASGSR